MPSTFRSFLLLLLCALASVLAADVHILNENEADALLADEHADWEKREIENCIPHDIRSFVLGSRGVVEWTTHRSYIAKVHKQTTSVGSPWQSCRDDSSVEVRFRKIDKGHDGEFAHKPAMTYSSDNDNYTTHTAFLTLEGAGKNAPAYEFVVGSKFHGWSNIHRLGDNHVDKSANKHATRCRPKHVHTSYGKTPGSFSVQWMTKDGCNQGAAQVKLERGYRTPITSSTPVVATATTTLFTDPGKQKIKRWMHVAHVTGLATNTRYTYMVGNAVYSWSIPYVTKTAPSREEAQSVLPMRFLVTGDIGYQNAATLPMMQSEVAEGHVDALLGMGDYAYDLHMANGHVGDIFMDEIEPIAASVPFMVAPGNHETEDVFSHYTERFRLMPSNTGQVKSGNGIAPNNWFYSLNVGLVHFAFISTEIYFKKTLEPGIVERQEAWLRADLAAANANRAETPWIIVVGHRPMYCTSDVKNCGKKADFLRARLEDLLYENGVDIYICGHQHNYERAFDVYRGETQKRTTDMRATTHILTGASGQYMPSIMRKTFEQDVKPWDAFRNSIFGYSRLQVFNATHVRWQQVESDPENPVAQGLYGQVVDDVWLVQSHHGSFSGQ